ncbi:hypothetical protein DICA1_F44562 [Diutina catenulata]
MTPVRFPRVNAVYQTALDKAVEKSLEDDKIAECFPSISSSEQGSRALQRAGAQIRNHLFKKTTQEVELIFEETGLEKKLNQLDDAVHEAEERATSGESVDALNAPLLTPEYRMDAAIAASTKDQVAELETLRTQLRQENAAMIEELARLAAQASDNVARVSAIYDSVQEEINSFAPMTDESRQEVSKLLES